MSIPLLAARGLALSYRRGAPPAFSGVDLAVRPREIVALVGESADAGRAVWTAAREEQREARASSMSHKGELRYGVWETVGRIEATPGK